VFPIVGGRKVEHLHANIEALSIALSDAHIAHLEGILPFDIGFPGNFFVSALRASRSKKSAEDARRKTGKVAKKPSSCAWAATRTGGRCSRPSVRQRTRRDTRASYNVKSLGTRSHARPGLQVLSAAVMKYVLAIPSLSMCDIGGKKSRAKFYQDTNLKPQIMR
jgi:hypothetical protein